MHCASFLKEIKMQVTKQIRGNCQCCGRDQAVKNGTMAKHGYTVEHGWFNGVCSGERFAPIQVSRTQTDKIIAEILAEIPQLLAKAEQVVMGKLFPQFVVVGRYDNRKTIPYADADVRDQRHACEQMVWELRNRASAGKAFTETLTSIANEYHGKPLTEVAKKEAPTPIGINEVKIMNGCRIVSTSVYGGKVNYKPEGLDTAWSCYVSTTKWRNLKTA
jgi:hypothetical protein